MANSRKKMLTVVETMAKFGAAPTMIYDRPKTYAQIRKMRRELAEHNMKVVPCGRQYIHVSPLDYDGLLPRNWLVVMDDIVFENGGGCQ